MYEEWIKEHLPDTLPPDLVSESLNHNGYYAQGLKVYCQNGGCPDIAVYSAGTEDELRIWLFKKVAEDISRRIEMRTRPYDARRWKYSRDHAENGRWMYIEHSYYYYKYNTIHDSGLAWFETYLRLVKSVLPPVQWDAEVRKYIRLMNQMNYREPHWDYDSSSLHFTEISESKYISQGIEEPAPGTVLRKELSVADSVMQQICSRHPECFFDHLSDLSQGIGILYEEEGVGFSENLTDEDFEDEEDPFIALFEGKRFDGVYFCCTIAGELEIMSYQEFYDFLCYNVEIRIDRENAEFQAKARQYLLTIREKYHLEQLLPL